MTVKKIIQKLIKKGFTWYYYDTEYKFALLSRHESNRVVLIEVYEKGFCNNKKFEDLRVC